MKKNRPAWYIAATHYLTAGLVVPLICNIVFSYISIFLSLSDTVTYIVALFVVIVSVWGGVVYSARYINQKYIIQSVNSIVNLSTVYLIVVRLIYTMGKFNQTGAYTNKAELTYTVVVLVITFALFYILSKKYISKYHIDPVA